MVLRMVVHMLKGPRVVRRMVPHMPKGLKALLGMVAHMGNGPKVVLLMVAHVPREGFESGTTDDGTHGEGPKV